MSDLVRRSLAELVGTAVLVLGGCGTAVLAGEVVGGTLGVSLAFGLSLVVLCYAIGSISGCHVNPAVTLGLLAVGKAKRDEAAAYVVAQLIGGLVGAVLLYLIAKGVDGFEITDTAGTFATNGYGDWSPGGYRLGAAIITELLMSAIFLFVIAGTFSRRFPAGFGGMAIGLTLALVHLISIPVTNTSVNPARSLGVAVMAAADGVTEPLAQVWLFLVAPVVGGAAGAVLYRALAAPDDLADAESAAAAT